MGMQAATGGQRGLAGIVLVALLSTASPAQSQIKATDPTLIPGQRNNGNYGPLTREAYVVVRAQIDEQGKVSSAAVVDGFYDEKHAAEGVAFIKRFRFHPGTVDGVPVASTLNIPVRFQLGAPPALTTSYRAALDDAVNFIRARDWDAANLQVQSMLADEVKTLYGYAVMQATLAETYHGQGRLFDALQSVRLATRSDARTPVRYVAGKRPPRNGVGNYMLPQPLLSMALRKRMQLEAALGLHVEALNTYTEIAGLRALPDDDIMVKLAHRLEAALQSPDDISTQVQLDRFGNWSLTPNRRIFTISSVQHGSLESLKLRCDRQDRDLPFQPDVEWTIPEKWGECKIRFDGTPNSAFTLHFFARDAAAP